MRKLSKAISLLTIVTLVGTMAAGCGSTSENGDAGSSSNVSSGSDSKTADWDISKEISVVSREDGSGTRGAFIELTGVEEKDAEGNKIDNTTTDAIITNNTEVMLSTVSGDDYAIGYVSLGSMNSSVKALKVNGVEVTAENIKAGTYEVARPFNIATKGDVSESTQDFINYILSAEGQAVVAENGYVTIDDAAPAFESNSAKGKVVVAGSSSVTPVMEKLKEGYEKVNADTKIEVQQSDSSIGMQSAIEGSCDIGMASRELKDTETAEGLTATVIAKDGIAIIVNNNAAIDDITVAQIKSIFTGETTVWSDIVK